MRLLVSVQNAQEATAALEGGADIIDAKDPARGTLGLVTSEMLDEITIAVDGARPISAAYGELREPLPNLRVGLAYAKLGFLGVTDPHQGMELAAQAVDIANSQRVQLVCVAYADVNTPDGLSRETIITIAAAARASGVMLDTANKHAGSLCSLVSPRKLRSWVLAGHRQGLMVGLAGSLNAQDLAAVHKAGADVVGVRGAACSGDRTSPISVERVQELAELVHTHYASLKY